EETKILNTLAAANDQRTVEGVAFGELQLTADDEIARLGIAGNVDALDIEPRALIHEIGHVERAGCHIAVEPRTDVDEGIALKRGFVGHFLDALLQVASRIGAALPRLHRPPEGIGVEAGNAGFNP